MTLDAKGPLRAWDLATGKSLPEVAVSSLAGALRTAALDPGGRWLVTACDPPAGTDDKSPTEILIHNLQENRSRHPAGDPVRALALAVSSSGDLTAAACADGVVRVWNTATSERRGELKAHEGEVTGVAFLPDGRLASCGADWTVRIWELESGKEVRHFVGPEALVRLACGSRGHIAAVDREGGLHVWNSVGPQESMTLAGHREGVTALAFTPDGYRLASAGPDGALRVWALDTGRASLILEGPPGPTFVAFSPNGKSLLAVGADRRVRQWDGDAE
jgi:WD40 repeat protein